MSDINEQKIVQDFVLDVWRRFPSEMIEGVHILQRATRNAETQRQHTKALARRLLASIEQSEDRDEYVKKATMHLADLGTKASMLRPLTAEWIRLLEAEDDEQKE